jgi:hypothetical protein
LRAALAETAGHEGLLYADVWALVRPLLDAAPLSAAERQILGMVLRLPGLGDLSLPLYLSHRGGPDLTVDVRVPFATLASAGKVLGLVGGGGLLGGALSPRP